MSGKGGHEYIGGHGKARHEYIGGQLGMVRRGRDTLVQSHPLYQALFAARHRGQGLSTSLYSATKYIIYTGISWPFSVGKRQPENTENKRLF